MKNKFLILLFILLGNVAYGQTKSISQDELLFEKGILLQNSLRDELELNEIISENDSASEKSILAREINESILEIAWDYYQELIDSFPNSKLYYRALNNRAFIELQTDDKEGAKATFLEILNSNADDKEKGGLGSGLMAEPNANYKNRATNILARLAYDEKDYKEALKYLDLNKKYPYQHFCGNAHASNRIYMSTMYAKCYIGLNQLDKAYEQLFPNIIENGLADNSELVELTYSTLLKNYNKKELKRLYAEAFKNYEVVKSKKKKDFKEDYYITFLGTRIKLRSWRLAFLDEDKKEKAINAMYENSKFYKLLNE